MSLRKSGQVVINILGGYTGENTGDKEKELHQRWQNIYDDSADKTNTIFVLEANKAKLQKVIEDLQDEVEVLTLQLAQERVGRRGTGRLPDDRGPWANDDMYETGR